MKPNLRSRGGFTLLELLITLVILAVVAVIFLLPLSRATARDSRLGCINNLKQVALGFRIWAQDHLDRFPAQVSDADGGAMELGLDGDVAAVYRVMSNELNTPKILSCPADTNRSYAENFGVGLQNTNVSYFVGLDATEANPLALLCGDDNVVGLAATRIRTGEMRAQTNYSWAPGRHSDYRFSFLGLTAGKMACGTVAFSDGRVERFDNRGLNQAWLLSGMATNRLLMP